jgi:hypothetical protein
MSKRNVESLSSFFNRCAAIGGFDEATTRIELGSTLPPWRVLAKRGSVLFCATEEEEVTVESTVICVCMDGDGSSPIDPEITRWLLRRARGEYSLPFGWSQSQLEAREARESFNLGEYMTSCKWGQNGNVFIGRRRVSWDGHDKTRLCVQGRVVATVTTDRSGRAVTVEVFTEAEAEAEFQANRAARREAEGAYKRALSEARRLVRKWKNGNGNGVEFTFFPGQMGGRIELQIDGLRAQVSANGAGIEAGFDVECPAHPMSASALRQWEREQEHEAALERAGLWRCPAPEDRKVRVKEWYGCERVLTVGDMIEGVGRVAAIAMPR